jgi:hypothetical protein
VILSDQVESYGEAIAEELARKDRLKSVLNRRRYGFLSELWLPMFVFSGGAAFLQKELGGMSWIFSAALAASWGLAVCALLQCRALERKVDALISLRELDHQEK